MGSFSRKFVDKKTQAPPFGHSLLFIVKAERGPNAWKFHELQSGCLWQASALSSLVFFFFLNVVGTCQVYYLFGFVVVFPENSRNTAICIDLDVKCPSLGFIRLKPWASASGGVLESCGTLRR